MFRWYRFKTKVLYIDCKYTLYNYEWTIFTTLFPPLLALFMTFWTWLIFFFSMFIWRFLHRIRKSKRFIMSVYLNIPFQVYNLTMVYRFYLSGFDVFNDCQVNLDENLQKQGDCFKMMSILFVIYNLLNAWGFIYNIINIKGALSVTIYYIFNTVEIQTNVCNKCSVFILSFFGIEYAYNISISISNWIFLSHKNKND